MAELYDLNPFSGYWVESIANNFSHFFSKNFRNVICHVHFGISIENASKWVQTSLCLVQGFLRWHVIFSCELCSYSLKNINFFQATVKCRRQINFFFPRKFSKILEKFVKNLQKISTQDCQKISKIFRNFSNNIMDNATQINLCLGQWFFELHVVFS